MARPNLIFIMSDDHASHAISAYGSRINSTPNIDRIAEAGMRFEACFCTNSICTPSRAAVLAGTYNHVNGVTTLDTPMDNSLITYPKLMQRAGYQTAIFGKWHLGHGPAHDPTGFDSWAVLPDQGLYHDPEFLTEAGVHVEKGYATDIITDLSLAWLDERDPSRPFALMIHHKAPHRPWEPDDRHAHMYDDVEIPEPQTFWDDYESRSHAAELAAMRMMDLREEDLKAPVPSGLSEQEEVSWRYQRYIKDYLRVVASIDDNVGRVLDWLESEDLADTTMVVYTSDQGFFLGDHGWFDKRFMYEESLTMPLLIRYPALIEPSTACDEMVLNVDFAPTFLALAGIDVPDQMQGSSFLSLLAGDVPEGWRQAMYYRYWMHRDRDHNVLAHYGIRTKTHKLICFYNDPLDQPGARGPASPHEWELFDLLEDPFETRNLIEDPAHAQLVLQLQNELSDLQASVGDLPASAD
jgi:arylsulfatase A-like enzyme